ncbi:MAG: DUF5666 domain-containing protein [Alphaproteobacteria bacterium]
MKRRDVSKGIYKRSAGAALLAGLLLLTGAADLKAQVGSPGTTAAIRGKIVSLRGSELIVASPNGDVKVTLGERTVIRGETPITFSEITSGMYLGTTATKQPDGNFLASEVHVFSEDQRGTGDGHYPLSSAPQSGATMTNGNVEHVEDMTVRNVNGRLMTVRYKGGEVQVFVPPDIPIVRRGLGDRSLLKLGAELSVRAARGSDGSLSATQITVRARR